MTEKEKADMIELAKILSGMLKKIQEMVKK